MKNKMSYSIFCTRHPEGHNLKHYNSLFGFWHTLWAETFKEKKGLERLYSDDFHRQDEVTGVFVDDQAIATIVFNWFSFENEAHRSHSYFRTYPPAILEKIENLGARKVMVMGSLAIAPAWRKSQNAVSTSEVLISIACKRFLESDADLLISYTRNERKMNDLCYRHGAQCLLANHSEHNDVVDIIAIRPEEAVIAPSRFSRSLVEELWSSRQIIGKQSHLREVSRSISFTLETEAQT